jgi:predicted enzyme related to lactoylglutathione lyase
VAAAREFYTSLFGWEGEGDELSANGSPVARLVPFDAAHGFASHWVSYVSVDDVDRAVRTAGEVGGACCVPPFDDGELGRFALLNDATKALTKPLESSADAGFDASPGRFVWEWLRTESFGRTHRFYEGLYGWHLFVSDAEHGILELGGEGVASVGRALAGSSEGAWVPCVRVEALEPALARARELGAKVVDGATEIPFVGRAAVIEDPVGARVGLLVPAKVSARKKRAVAPAPAPRAPKKSQAPAPAPSTLTPRELFSRLPGRLDPEGLKTIRGVLQYHLSGPDGGDWHVVFDGESVRCLEGTHETPDVTLVMRDSDYVELALGRIAGPVAVAQGKLRITGDFQLPLRMGKIRKPLD